MSTNGHSSARSHGGDGNGGAKRRRGSKRFVLLVVVPLVALAAGLGIYLVTGGSVSTEDAYVKANQVGISAQVAGPVIAVDARDNGFVTRGQELFRIDPRPYQIALARATANLAATRDQVRAARALYGQRQAELASAQAALAWTQREYDRQRRLALSRVISVSKLDQLNNDLDAARQKAAAAAQALAGVKATLGNDPTQPIDEMPQVRQALAAQAQAQLDLEHTVVTAPADGVTAKVGLQVGDYVTAGQPVFVLVTGRPWVEANLKETDLTHVAVGEEAEITVDAYPGRTWRARVQSISPATGSEFSVLPAQNSSGNWVKVVQRVPVRLAVEDTPDGPTLRAGMSVWVKIHTGERHSLAGLAHLALGGRSSETVR